MSEKLIGGRKGHAPTKGVLEARKWEAAISALAHRKREMKKRTQRPVIAFADDGKGKPFRFPSASVAAAEFVKRGYGTAVSKDMVTIALAAAGVGNPALGHVWSYDWEQIEVPEGHIKMGSQGKGVDAHPVGRGKSLHFESITAAANYLMEKGLVRNASSCKGYIATACKNSGGAAAYGYRWTFSVNPIVGR